jgi:hypothetical protein
MTPTNDIDTHAKYLSARKIEPPSHSPSTDVVAAEPRVLRTKKLFSGADSEGYFHATVPNRADKSHDVESSSF